MLKIFILILSFWSVACFSAQPSSAAIVSEPVKIPILTYHRFDPSHTDSMTITTAAFEAQLQWLKDHHYTVIPLKKLVNYLQGNEQTLPPKPVVITADDGHKSIYTEMLPLVRKYNIPVTLFIYPSAISKASYAMTWEQLIALQKTALFDIQGHTYWHPNFKQDKKKLSPSEYEKLVETQLDKSKAVLEKKLGTPITLLAWPFGIYDDYLMTQAAKAGYSMAFSIDARPANRSEKAMAQPRYMIVKTQSLKNFEMIVGGK